MKMRSTIMISFLLALLPLQAQSPRKAATALLSSDRTSCTLGDKITLTVRLQNSGSEPFSIYKYLLWGFRGGLALDVTDASGRKVEPEQLDEDSVIPSTLEDQKSFLALPPLYQWGIAREDSTRNLFKKQGRYLVRLKYVSPVPREFFGKLTAWATEDGPVLSNVLTIDVK